MRKTKVFIGLFLLVALFLAACSGQPANDVMNDLDKDTSHNTNAEMDNKDDEMMEDDSSHSDDAMDDSMNDKNDEMSEDSSDGEMAEDSNESVMIKGPAWHGFEFTNVSTGETFSLGQFRGKVVLVETMATWCSNCLKQQNQVKEFHNMLGARDDFLSVGISLEAGINPSQLVSYIQDRGFDWTYSVAPNEVQEGIVESLGGQFLNPPATPMFVIDKEGNMHPLPLGKIKSAAELLAFVEPFL